MLFKCKCEKCNKITVIDTDVIENHPEITFQIGSGYLVTDCRYCKSRAYAVNLD